MRNLPSNRTVLLQRATCPLAVELRSDPYGGDTRSVSLFHAKTEYNEIMRILSMDGQTAIKLHKWLTDNMSSLIALAKQEEQA